MSNKVEKEENDGSSSDEFFDAKDELDSNQDDENEVQIDTTTKEAMVTESIQEDCELVVEKQTSSDMRKPHSYINADFHLGKFCLTLVYNSTDRQGITIFSSELSVNF